MQETSSPTVGLGAGGPAPYVASSPRTGASPRDLQLRKIFRSPTTTLAPPPPLSATTSVGSLNFGSRDLVGEQSSSSGAASSGTGEERGNWSLDGGIGDHAGVVPVIRSGAAGGRVDGLSGQKAEPTGGWSPQVVEMGAWGGKPFYTVRSTGMIGGAGTGGAVGPSTAPATGGVSIAGFGKKSPVGGGLSSDYNVPTITSSGSGRGIFVCFVVGCIGVS